MINERNGEQSNRHTWSRSSQSSASLSDARSPLRPCQTRPGLRSVITGRRPPETTPQTAAAMAAPTCHTYLTSSL